MDKFSTIFTSRGKNGEIFVKSILELKIKSFNIIIAIGWVLEGKDSKYDMSCRQASLVSNELLTQKENCSWPKLKDKLRLDEKNFEEGGGGCSVSKMMMMLPDL